MFKLSSLWTPYEHPAEVALRQYIAHKEQVKTFIEQTYREVFVQKSRSLYEAFGAYRDKFGSTGESEYIAEVWSLSSHYTASVTRAKSAGNQKLVDELQKLWQVSLLQETLLLLYQGSAFYEATGLIPKFANQLSGNTSDVKKALKKLMQQRTEIVDLLQKEVSDVVVFQGGKVFVTLLENSGVSVEKIAVALLEYEARDWEKFNELGKVIDKLV